jgi:hypothetical protein
VKTVLCQPERNKPARLASTRQTVMSALPSSGMRTGGGKQADNLN